ncbi:MAG: DNA primase [Eubacteriales bacterium]|nr:DNA primase [Eubacteriales bacterium]
MAGRFPPAWLDELRARADIVKVVSAYVPLKKNGHRYAGLCPFHNEKSPSFYVDDQKQLYHCFGCKAGGSVIQFVMEIERLSFPEAVAFLAEQLHMPLPEMQNDPAYEQRRSLKERIYLANQAAARLYHQYLWQPEGAEILAYLQKRGLSDTVIRRFGIGAAPQGAHAGKALQAQGFTEQELVQAGLMLSRDGRSFDMFRNRAMFPIIDAYGHVLGFGGRAMGDVQPKYLNTSDTPAFNKRYNVFAANLLRKAKGLTRVILVEGYMDVVALSQFGVEGVAATLGTALTPEQARLLARYAPEIHLAYDGDRAGQKAILRGLEVFEAEQVPVKVLDFPGGLDPDEYIRQEGTEAFHALKPISGTLYRLLREKEKYDLGSEEGRTEYAKGAALILQKVRQPVELENYVKRLSMETGFTREVLMEQIGASPQKEAHEPVVKREAFEQKAREVKKKDWTACTLLAVLATGRLPEGSVAAEEFDDPQLRAVCEALLAGESAAELMERETDDQGRAVLGDLLSIDTTGDDDALMRMAQDCLSKMRRARLEKELERIQKELPGLPEDARSVQTERAMQIMRRLQELKTGSATHMKE